MTGAGDGARGGAGGGPGEGLPDSRWWLTLPTPWPPYLAKCCCCWWCNQNRRSGGENMAAPGSPGLWETGSGRKNSPPVNCSMGW